ncbi:unnamed protein product [Adineta steineri]|uniref:Uncharacterized protein n=1 Tax=Adineta steineri TaxID=433720 RepID=A0A814BS18_9BILA|nr:unnamed protein product [Adineta steineri]
MCVNDSTTSWTLIIDIKDVTAQYLGDALQHNASLTTLNLQYNQIGDVGAQRLADALQHNTTLITLDFCHNKIGDVGARSLGSALQCNTTLTTLNIWCNQIGDIGTQHLADALQRNTTLTTLCLSNNHIGDVGVQHLADTLQHNTSLTTLNLQYNQIGDVGAQRLADALQHNTTLTKLNLSHNQIGDVGVQYLVEALQHNTFIILIVQIKSQICENVAQYDRCSTNSACGCFHRVGTSDDTGVCGFLWPTCSHLVPCNASTNSCAQLNTVCVQHPRCHELPLCYPIALSKQNICPPKTNKISFKWKQNAITVAGGNGYGEELDQLNRPFGIFIDKKKNIFIADVENHRIVEWKYNAKEGQIIAGGNGQGNRMNQLNYPTDVIVDQQDHSVIIADWGNKRVIQWLNQNQQILIDNIDCYGLAMDKYGFLFVSDWIRNEVRRWKIIPTFIFVDEDQSVYVTDAGNHRVMKWRKDAKEGIVVAGGNGYGGNLSQLLSPQGIIVDDLGQIYVTDGGNHRVMRWCEGKEEGEIVVGGNGGGIQSNQLNDPIGLSFDNEGNLYVADHFNYRIQRFEIIL